MSTQQRLNELLQRSFQLPPERLVPGATLESLEIDSLRMIEIVFDIEEAFGITVPAEHGELRAKIKTLGDLAAYIDTLLPPARE